MNQSLAWRDSTSYSQSEPHPRTPRTFSLQEKHLGKAYITVTCGHIYFPGKWIMFCGDLRIDQKELRAKTEAEAKAEAIAICAERAQALADTYKSLAA